MTSSIKERCRATRRQRKILVADICPKCNRYTVYKTTNIYSHKVSNYLKVEVCTGCVRRLDSCDCKMTEKRMFMNKENQAALRQKVGGEPIFKFHAEGNGRVKDKRS